MRVGVVLEQLRAAVPGGTGRYSRDLVEALQRTRPADDEVVAWATAGPDLGVGVPVRALRTPRKVLPRLWERGLGPRLTGADVIHAPTLLVPARTPVPLVVTIHDAVPWTHPETLTARGVRFHRRMARRAAREARLIVTPTQAVATRLQELLDPDCPVVAVPPGVSDRGGPVPHAGHAEHQPTRARTPDRPYVLFVGTLEPRKGLDVLTSAMTDSRLAGLDLVCVGPSGWGGVSLADLAARSGLAARLRPAGFVTDRELAGLYAGARVLVMPSRAEGFGLPVLEAMASGTPVVVSDDPALVEVAGGAAVVTPVGDVGALADAVYAVALHEERRQQMSAEGRARAADFSWDASGRRLWRLYREVWLRG